MPFSLFIGGIGLYVGFFLDTPILDKKYDKKFKKMKYMRNTFSFSQDDKSYNISCDYFIV